MVLENICPPALLYLGFSVIQIVIDLFKGDAMQAFFKFLVMIIFTIILNALCSAGMSVISWFIVFIPFILMTYITTILFFIFGFNPGKIKEVEQKCLYTQFGCCDDGVTKKTDFSGRNCPVTEGPMAANNKDDKPWAWFNKKNWRKFDWNIGGCSGTQYGCCPDGITSRNDNTGSNCAPFGTQPTQPTQPTQQTQSSSCSTSQFGCCGDNVTAKIDNMGTNCAPQPNKPNLNKIFM